TNGPSAPRISPRTEFVRSLAFSAGGSAVASRVAGDEVQVFPFDEEPLRDAAQPQKRVRLRIPPGDMQEMVSPRWPQLRPLLAGTKVGENWRVAWLTQGGAAVMEGPAGEGAVGRRLLGDKPLLTGVDNASRLNFSKDGHFLTVQQRIGGRTQGRIFDLTNQRAESIPKSGRELRDLACDTAELPGLPPTQFVGNDNLARCSGTAALWLGQSVNGLKFRRPDHGIHHLAQVRKISAPDDSCARSIPVFTRGYCGPRDRKRPRLFQCGGQGTVPFGRSKMVRNL